MSARQVPPTSSPSRLTRWLAGAGMAAAVVAVIVAVQAAAGGADQAVGGRAAVVPSTAPDALTVRLFGAGTAEVDVTRTTSDDVGAAWPIAGCAAAVAVDTARVDFVSGTERGLEYSRDLAIGWYLDAAAARAAYDAVVERIAACAAEAGWPLTTGPAALGEVGSISVALAAATGEAVPDADAAAGAVEASLAAVAQAGSVVVLSVDQSAFYGPPPSDSAAATTAQAERLLAEACQVASAGC